MTNRKLGVLGAIFFGSLLLTYYTNTNDYLHTLAQYPAIASLLGLLALIVLDEVRYQKVVRQKELETINTLFAGSHYAASIYNKHLEFCEAYWQRTLEAIKELTAKGGCPEMVNRANSLYAFRMDHAIWLTEDMNLGLETFEMALRRMGADSVYLKDLPVGDKRSEVVERMHTTFLKVLMPPPEFGKTQDPLSYLAVLKELQKILGITEAYEYRRATIQRIR